MSVVVVIGNPSPGGRTTTVGQAVGAAVAAARGETEVDTIELAGIAPTCSSGATKRCRR